MKILNITLPLMIAAAITFLIASFIASEIAIVFVGVYMIFLTINFVIYVIAYQQQKELLNWAEELLNIPLIFAHHDKEWEQSLKRWKENKSKL